MSENLSASNIEQILSTFLSQATKNKKRQQLFLLIQQLKSLSKEIALCHDIAMQYSEENLIQKLKNKYGIETFSAASIALEDSKMNILKENAENILLEKSLEGYEAVNKVRQFITKQKIYYSLGVGSQRNTSFYQIAASYKELSSNIYLERRSEGYSLRIRLSRKALQEIQNQRKNQYEEGISALQKFMGDGSTLYSAIYRYFTQNRLGDKGKGNWGHFYEVYRYLYYKSPKRNNYKPQKSTINKAFNSVLAGGGSSGSFSGGGDVGLEQDKFSAGSNPTLSSVSTIINQLDLLSLNLEELINNNDTDSLVKFLTRQKIGIKTIDQARNQAIQNIKDFAKTLI